MGATRTRAFGDRVAERVAERASQLVLGLDPNPARLWPQALQLGPTRRTAGDTATPPAVLAARAVAAHCSMVIDAVAQECVAVKFQVACFERLGAPGWEALAGAIDAAAAHGLLVIADAKRGDVDVTAAAYAEAYFGTTSTPFGDVRSLAADALTVSPLLGRDSLAPFVTRATEHGGGLFILVRTSNPGAIDVEELQLASGGSVSERLAALVHELGAPSVSEAGLSDVGAVVGATAPERLARLRELMPRTIFLLPGVGAQGGRIEDLAAAFAPGRAGGLVSASRGIVAAYERTSGDPADAALREAARLRELAWALGERHARP
jgi:orotidine-5'-phosphate decarboxylase